MFMLLNMSLLLEYKDINSFGGDLLLVFDNALVYNKSTSYIYKLAAGD